MNLESAFEEETMTNKIHPIGILIPIAVIFAFLIIAGGIQGYTHDIDSKQPIETTIANPYKVTNKDYPIQYVECGTCGAHVLEWWKVLNDEGSKWVNVCGKCYDNIIDEERTISHV